MKTVKAVSFSYKPTSRTKQLLQTFRMMVNDAIHICLDEEIKGRLKLRNRIYQEFLERYGVVSCYPYTVAEVAWSIVKKHKRWHRRPIANRPMMKMDAASYSLNHSILSLPVKKGERLLIPVEYGAYQRSFLVDEALKRGSVTMTESSIVIAFSKETQVKAPLRKMGIDLNEKSAVVSDGTTYDLSEVARLHTEYGLRRRKFSSRNSQDQRLRRKFSLGSREGRRVKQFLNRVSKQIVQKAKESRQAIILERLKGIRVCPPEGQRREQIVEAKDCPVALQRAAASD